MPPPQPSSAAPGFENAQPQHEPIPLPVKGQIPPWLCGSLYRTGPGTFHIHPAQNNAPSISVSHWFDGLGMNHHFKITPTGQVHYSNRSSSDGRIDYIRQTGRAPSSTFGKHKDPCEQLFQKFFTTFVPHPNNPPPGRDMENISVTLTPNIPGLSSHNNTTPGLRYLVAATDSNWLQIIDPTTLQPIQTTTYAQISPSLSGHLSAAHSCVDPTTHEHFNYIQKFSSQPGSSVYKVFKLTPTTSEKPKVDILAEITDAPMAYVHSFALTKRFVVLCVWQCDYGECVLTRFLVCPCF
jgi:torulene dioxygenase